MNTRTPNLSGRIEIKVSEPMSQILITDSKGKAILDHEPLFSPADGSALITDELRPGTYSVIVRKTNVLERRVRLKVPGGKTEKLSVELSPSVAFLTVFTNVDQPEIEIEGLGVFRSPLERSPIGPGRYRVTVRGKGYLPRTEPIEITGVGTENTLIVNLSPIPVTEMLAEAARRIEEKDLERAIALCADILESQSENSRAHLLLGRAGFLSGSSEAHRSLVKALQLGDVVTLTVRSFTTAKPLGVYSGELIIDRNYIQFRNNIRPELNFSLLRSNIGNLTIDLDKNNVRYVSFKGTGEFNGKRADRRVFLYSSAVALKATQTFCISIHGGTLRCESDAANLHNVLAGWLSQR